MSDIIHFILHHVLFYASSLNIFNFSNAYDLFLRNVTRVNIE